MAILKGGTVSGITIVDEVPAGAIDGINVSFTTSFTYVSGTLKVYINGIKQELSLVTETSSQTFDLEDAPIAGVNPDSIEVTYQKA